MILSYDQNDVNHSRMQSKIVLKFINNGQNINDISNNVKLETLKKQ